MSHKGPRPTCHEDPSAERSGYGLSTYAGAAVFCPLSQQPARKFGRYGLVKLLLPRGSCPTFGVSLIRAIREPLVRKHDRCARSLTDSPSYRIACTSRSPGMVANRAS